MRRHKSISNKYYVLRSAVESTFFMGDSSYLRIDMLYTGSGLASSLARRITYSRIKSVTIKQGFSYDAWSSNHAKSYM